MQVTTIKLGIQDKNGVEIEIGQEVEVSIQSWDGKIIICHGPIVWRGKDISSLGCGYGIEDERKGFTFLSNISKSGVDIEVKSDGQQSLF